MTNKLNKYGFIFVGALVFALFTYITVCTPLAGDDWGYALNGMDGHPIQMALMFYQTWSGRFFSELWGFVVAPRKWLWNILNPLLFTIIFVFSYLLTNTKKNGLIIASVLFAMMLSVDDFLRMQTYTWIMGTTYVVPLAMSVIYFYICDYVLFKNQNKGSLLLVGNILLFYIGLTMENIAAMMIVATIALTVYAWFTDRKLVKYFALNVLCSVVSFLIMRSSPGSTWRLMNENLEWYGLNLIEKLMNGLPYFMQYTFFSNNYLILLLSLSSILAMISTRESIGVKWISCLVSALGAFIVFSFAVIKGNNFLLDGTKLYNLVFWIIYVINVFVVICCSLENENLIRGVFFLCMAGGSNLVMLYSPIFGPRSSLYLVYFLMIVACLLFSKALEDKKTLILLTTLLVAFVVLDRSKEFITKYSSVARAYKERLQIVEYYKEHPEDESVWIPRMPIYTVHSADIEPADTYHLDCFKRYYQLPQNAENIVFYFKESY